MFNVVKWIQAYRTATKQTKYFVLNWLLYGLAIVATTVYCYVRLDAVRHTHVPAPHAEKNHKNF